MKAAVYLRVSTTKQTEANQEPDCLRICEARQWQPRVFREQESGAKVRPVWQSVLTGVHRGEFGAVVVWSLDRAGRNRVRLAHDLAELARKGATVVSVRESWIDQPVGPLRDLLISILAWMAESERDRLRDRTRAGLARALAQGKTLGRRPVAPEVVEGMRRAWQAGKLATDVAHLLGVPGSTVRTYFRRFEEGGAKKGAASAPVGTARNQGEDHGQT